MKKFKNIVLLFFTLMLLICCHSRYYVDLSKITFEKIELKRIEKTDSVRLELGYRFPPKTFGKKAVAVCLPVIIEGADTLKFHTKTSAGEKYDDEVSIIFKNGGYFYLIDTLKAQNQINDSMRFIIQFNLYKSKENPHIVYKEKLCKLLN